jgi:hypothetical protein
LLFISFLWQRRKKKSKNESKNNKHQCFVSLYANVSFVGTKHSGYSEGERKSTKLRSSVTQKKQRVEYHPGSEKSVEVIERVGAAQLSKQGVGDVATAVTKATGTLKQEGSANLC